MAQQNQENPMSREIEDLFRVMEEFMRIVASSVNEKRRITDTELNDMGKKVEGLKKQVKDAKPKIYKESLRDIFSDPQQAEAVRQYINYEKTRGDERNQDYFRTLEKVSHDPTVLQMARDDFKNNTVIESHPKDPLKYESISHIFPDKELSKAVLKNVNEHRITTKEDSQVRPINQLYEAAGYQPLEKDLKGLKKKIRSIDEPITQEELDLIRELDIQSLQVTDLTGIGRLRNLEILHAGDNLIEKIPKEIENLTKLKELDLRMNYLKTLPDEVSQLVSLNKIALNDNNFTQIPSVLKELNTQINMEGNPLDPLQEEKDKVEKTMETAIAPEKIEEKVGNEKDAKLEIKTDPDEVEENREDEKPSETVKDVPKERKEIDLNEQIKQFEAELKQDPQAVLRYVSASGHFNEYSKKNQKRIYVQNPDATLVAGASAFREMGLKVLRGEKGIEIMAPQKHTFFIDTSGKERPIAEAGIDEIIGIENGEIKTVEHIEKNKFITTMVYDISQTNAAKEEYQKYYDLRKDKTKPAEKVEDEPVYGRSYDLGSTKDEKRHEKSLHSNEHEEPWEMDQDR